MLTQRKRFNYNVGLPQIRTSHSKSKLITTPISTPISLISKDQNLRCSKVVDTKETSKKIEELEAVNKKLIEETTQQFKRLQSDVQRVEKILQEKQSYILDLQSEFKSVNSHLEKEKEEKNLLIEAILQKDLVIKEYEDKLKELLSSKVIERQTTIQIEKLQNSSQTDPFIDNSLSKQLTNLQSINSDLEQQLTQVKQDLFDARNKIKVITQQFQAYKLLKSIEDIQQI